MTDPVVDTTKYMPNGHISESDADNRKCPITRHECCGQKCMAWRWAPMDRHQLVEDQGYCGMVPVPPSPTMTSAILEEMLPQLISTIAECSKTNNERLSAISNTITYLPGWATEED